MPGLEGVWGDLCPGGKCGMMDPDAVESVALRATDPGRDLGRASAPGP